MVWLRAPSLTSAATSSCQAVAACPLPLLSLSTIKIHDGNIASGSWPTLPRVALPAAMSDWAAGSRNRHSRAHRSRARARRRYCGDSGRRRCTEIKMSAAAAGGDMPGRRQRANLALAAGARAGTTRERRQRAAVARSRSTTTMDPVAKPMLASGLQAHICRTWSSSAVASLTPRGASRPMGCLAGLAHETRPHPQMKPPSENGSAGQTGKIASRRRA